jgi:hypothetical protein
MRFKARALHGSQGCLVFAGALVVLLFFWMAATQAAMPEAGVAEPPLIPRAYLPFIALSTCPGNVVTNGGFEQGGKEWHQYTTGTGWKAHDLIGSDAEGFHPHEGHYAAKLGGYEGVWDVLTQTVSIPPGGQLSYWWQMGTYESSIFYDHLGVELLTPDGEQVSLLAYHDVQGPEGIWQQDVVDVSAYAGQTLNLRFYAYNDNYFFSWFDLDEVCLAMGW